MTDADKTGLTHGSDGDEAAVSGPGRRFYIDDCYVDEQANRLLRGDQEVRLEAKSMQVLVYLADRAGELVTREALEADVWAGKVVGYDSLTGTINKLRKALNDNSRNPRFIETVSKKGYRLIATVRDSMPGEVQETIVDVRPGARKGKLVMSLVLFAAGVLFASALVLYLSRPQAPEFHTSDGPSIVVLPFSDLSQASNQGHLSDGITEDITTALSKLSGLFVIARSSAMLFQDESLDAKQVAEQLGVQYVLEGSVRRAGKELRVNTALVDGSTGFQLWSESYDREMKDIFDVQDDITAKIVKALSVRLTEREKQRIARKYTISIDAYDEFLQGQLEYARQTREDNLWARESFKQSIELDPNFARAYSAMALTYSAEFRYGWHNNPQGSLAFAEKFAKQAVSIDDQLPHAYWVLGYVHMHQGRFEDAINAASKAIELNPNHADSYATLGIIHIYNGEPEKGIRLMRQAMRLSPHYPAAYASAIGQGYFFLGEFDNALPLLQEAVERNVNLLTSQVFYVATLSALDRQDELAFAMDQLRTLVPDFSVKQLPGMFPFKHENDLARTRDALLRAGLE